MKIAFLVERNIYFRFFGEIIDMALKRSHQVFCFHDYNQQKTGSKGYQFPDINQTPNFKNGKVTSLTYENQEELKDKILQQEIKVIVSLGISPIILNIQNKLKEKAVCWVALQNGFDIAFSGIDMDKPDKFFIYSWEWLEWMFEYLKKTNQAKVQDFQHFKSSLQDRVEAVGFWLCQKQSLISLNQIKKKWGIPLDKKVVLFLPFPFGSSLKTFWTKCVYGTRFFSKENDFRLTGAIREFCDKNNAILLVKCRKKDPAKRYLVKMADEVIYDESFYPSTTMECFSIADVCFNFYSTVALESVAMGVSNVCIAPDISNWKDINNVFWQTILDKEKDFFDFSGVSYLKTIPEIINNLPKQTFADFSFDKEAQAQYLQKFANSNIEVASANIIAEIEKLEEKR